MKILIYFNSIVPAGGIERVISDLSNAWSEKYDVTILTKDGKESFYPLKKAIKLDSLDAELTLNMKNRMQRVFSLFFNFFKSVRRLKLFLKSNDFDYVYTATPLNSLEMSLAKKKKSKLKMIITEHASVFGMNKVYNNIKKWVYPKAYRVVSPTKTDTEIYKELGYPVVYIPHLAPMGLKPKKAGLKSKTVLNIGRLTSDKDQRELLLIWREIVQNPKLADWKLQIVGKGELYDNLMQNISTYDLGNSIDILNPSKNVAAFYSNADIFALTSVNEGFGMVLLEAMFFGLPCISYDIDSGPRDIITDNRNGFLVENRRREMYVKKLSEYMLLSQEEKEYYGKNATITAMEWNNQEILTKWDSEIFDY